VKIFVGTVYLSEAPVACLYSREQPLAWLVQEVGIRIQLVYYTISYTTITHHLTHPLNLNLEKG
jgi:hypothetical protein